MTAGKVTTPGAEMGKHVLIQTNIYILNEMLHRIQGHKYGDKICPIISCLHPQKPPPPHFHRKKLY